MPGGLWVHRIDHCGGIDGVLRKAICANADRIIIKTRDGRSAYNKNGAAALATAAKECGLDVWLWAWFYATTETNHAGYIQQQADNFCDDARRFGATGVVLNLEAPWSAAIGHRWAGVLRDQFGNKPARKSQLRKRCIEMINSVKQQIPDRIVAVSTFPIPSSHALPFEAMALHADEIWPQVYFRGMGYQAKIRKSVTQWTKLGAHKLYYSGPGWLGPTKQRAMSFALRSELTPDAQIDWWVADKMDVDDLESAAALAQEGCHA